jgi:hypothetical protein
MKLPIAEREDRMESVLSIIGAITGVAGLLVAILAVLVSVLVVRRQEKVHDRELAEERARHDRELVEERARHDRELVEERVRHDRELAVEQARNDRSERLTFLSDRIFDISIPRNLRQPFYEEYISMKGNGTAVKFWLMEGEMKNKQPG